MAEGGAGSMLAWVEKYRPRTVGEIAHQDAVVSTLQKALKTNNLPHLLFYGPPGTGKTSTALAVAREMYGPELMKTRVLELNASDERGIAVVRTKIKNFASQAVGQPVPGYPCPPYKLIILDEADAMTGDAQNALRRTMELHSKVTRFCFCCNYVSRIIEPLASRCAKFRFQPLSAHTVVDRVKLITSQERLSMEAGSIETLLRVAGGDMRRAITTLQSAARLNEGAVGPQGITDVAGVVPDSIMMALLGECRQKSFDRLQVAVQDTLAEAYPAQQVLLQMADLIAEAGDIKDVSKAAIFAVFSEADFALCEGADDYLQLLRVCSEMQRILTQ